MGLKRYDVVVNGYPTTLLLSDQDAAKHGLSPRDETKAAPVAEPSSQPAKKAAAKKSTARKAPAKKAAPKPANKVRDDVANKGA